MKYRLKYFTWNVVTDSTLFYFILGKIINLIIIFTFILIFNYYPTLSTHSNFPLLTVQFELVNFFYGLGWVDFLENMKLDYNPTQSYSTFKMNI